MAFPFDKHELVSIARGVWPDADLDHGFFFPLAQWRFASWPTDGMRVGGERAVSGWAPLRGSKARQRRGIIAQVLEAHGEVTAACEIPPVFALAVQDVLRCATKALGKLDIQVVRVQGDFAADCDTALVAAQIIPALAVAQISGDAREQRLAALVKHLFTIRVVGQWRCGGFQKKPDQMMRGGR